MLANSCIHITRIQELSLSFLILTKFSMQFGDNCTQINTNYIYIIIESFNDTNSKINKLINKAKCKLFSYLSEKGNNL